MKGKKVFLLSLFFPSLNLGTSPVGVAALLFPILPFLFSCVSFFLFFIFISILFFYFFHTSSLATLQSPQVIFKNPLGISSPLHLVSSPPPF
ncbi:hypothetical protein BDV41DRAFT_535117 [Aspergillus transmontanensis]|uniref:Uncharacterized protein n=1 Tax=Aspergillus transmontanensis TaxID=1034304 RepID=A0A5N6W035_9EURO|nr:hypothetical protein BDV41DRAFT_535117 [Aspergillus transmontanensis]